MFIRELKVWIVEQKGEKVIVGYQKVDGILGSGIFL
jgi:hypothetical protein